MSEYTELTYHGNRPASIEGISDERRKVIEWVHPNEDVLEIACHTGLLSQWLSHEKKCRVTGVDINPNALELAKEFLYISIEADIESTEFWDQLADKKFDTIVCMHILEHLVSPWVFLKKIAEYLTKDGQLIVALPNINNAQDRFKILFGNFNYTRDGVMDKTHLRFFNQETARQLIDSAGLEVLEYYSPWKVNPIHYFLDHLPVFWRIKKLFSPNKAPWLFRKKANITDVVMLFRCIRKSSAD